MTESRLRRKKLIQKVRDARTQKNQAEAETYHKLVAEWNKKKNVHKSEVVAKVEEKKKVEPTKKVVAAPTKPAVTGKNAPQVKPAASKP